MLVKMIETGVSKLGDGAGCRVVGKFGLDCFQCRRGKSWDGFADSDCAVKVVKIYCVNHIYTIKKVFTDIVVEAS